jgi:hypothetical protein
MSIPVLKTSSRIWQVLGGALYRTRPLLPITIREVFQNSRDACRGLGREPEIFVTLETDDFKQGILTCRDNGCGMSEETLLTKFLVLGESEKVAGSTGGWGIAKSVLVGGACRWKLWTNDLFLSSEHLEEGRPIDRVAPIIGTKIVLEYEPIPESDLRYGVIRLTPAAFVQGIAWLFHSSAPCVIRLIYQGKETVWTSPGLATSEDSRLCGETGDRTSWQLHQLTALAPEPVQCASYGRYSVVSAGMAYYRLNGLTQFSNDVSGDHRDVFVVDIQTQARPGDGDYPFTPSREAVTGELPGKVRDAITPHRTNPLTSMIRRQDRKKPVDVVYYAGASLGKAGRRRESVETQRLADAQLTVASNVALSHASLAQRITVQGRFISPTGVKLLFKGMTRTRRDVLSAVNRRFLLAWGKVVDLILEANAIEEEFGIGFLFHPSEAAERHVDSNGAYYLINPTLVSLRSSKPDETLLRMFLVAAHEISHKFYPDHTEAFASQMAALSDAAATLFFRQQRELKAALRGKCDLPAMQVVSQLPLEMQGI